MAGVSFTIDGELAGKGRPRFRAFGKGQVTTYTPPETVAAEKAIATLARVAMGARPPFEGAVHLALEIREKPPVSWSIKKQVATRFITSRPDADNQVKLIGDACNKIIWKDDAQIAQLSVLRIYDANYCQTTVRVELLEPEQASLLT